jgi:hypothetical protein
MTTEQMDWLDDHDPEWQAKSRKERNYPRRKRDTQPSGFRIRPMFAWYDMWIGAFYDKPRRRLYIFPIPCFGLRIEFGGRDV